MGPYLVINVPENALAVLSQTTNTVLTTKLFMFANCGMNYLKCFNHMNCINLADKTFSDLLAESLHKFLKKFAFCTIGKCVMTKNPCALFCLFVLLVSYLVFWFIQISFVFRNIRAIFPNWSWLVLWYDLIDTNGLPSLMVGAWRRNYGNRKMLRIGFLLFFFFFFFTYTYRYSKAWFLTLFGHFKRPVIFYILHS